MGVQQRPLRSSSSIKPSPLLPRPVTQQTGLQDDDAKDDEPLRVCHRQYSWGRRWRQGRRRWNDQGGTARAGEDAAGRDQARRAGEAGQVQEAGGREGGNQGRNQGKVRNREEAERGGRGRGRRGLWWTQEGRRRRRPSCTGQGDGGGAG